MKLKVILIQLYPKKTNLVKSIIFINWIILTIKENSVVTITGSLKCLAECTSNNVLLKESVERVIRGPITDYIIQHGPYILKVEKNEGDLYPNTANVIVKIKMIKNEEGQ